MPTHAVVLLADDYYHQLEKVVAVGSWRDMEVLALEWNGENRDRYYGGAFVVEIGTEVDELYYQKRTP
jgi:hypothetical protein